MRDPSSRRRGRIAVESSEPTPSGPTRAELPRPSGPGRVMASRWPGLADDRARLDQPLNQEAEQGEDDSAEGRLNDQQEHARVRQGRSQQAEPRRHTRSPGSGLGKTSAGNPAGARCPSRRRRSRAVGHPEIEGNRLARPAEEIAVRAVLLLAQQLVQAGRLRR